MSTNKNTSPSPCFERLLFGPVLSRRLGRSLGVDLLPFKTCTLDCVYCECGPTTNLSTQRQIFVPTKRVKQELTEFLQGKPRLDYITFAGSGEPTLAANLGRILRYLQQYWPGYPTAVLTNGTLLGLPAVRKDLASAALVVPSLDAATPAVFQQINHPARNLDLTKVVDGLIAFSRTYTGKLWLEVFLIPGINDTWPELEALKKILLIIQPERIQLNSLDRPVTLPWVRKPTAQELQRVAAFLSPLPVEIVARTALEPKTIQPCSLQENPLNLILDTLRRRPCTKDDLAQLSGLAPEELRSYLQDLQNQQIITTVQNETTLFFTLC